MDRPDHLFRSTLAGTAPLIVWAAHFFFSYIYAEMACMDAADPRPLLLALTATAIAACLWLLRRACRSGGRSLLDAARIGGALLSAIGIAWAGAPLLLLPGC